MRNKIDNFLLGTLWILVSTLGLCFWFNIQFGFNLLSSSHWHHLSYMQATRAPITPSFYISLVIGVFFIIYGLYLLIRPRFRKIPLPVQSDKNPSLQQSANTVVPTATNEFELSRPRRLMGINHTESLATNTQTTTPVVPLTAPVINSTQQQSEPLPHPIQKANNVELEEIFTSSGYTVKKAPRINGYQTALIAIGTNENVWLGAVGIETTTLQSIIDTIQQVFSDTLDDIEITIHGFVIDAPDASNATQNILTFATTEALREYMQTHPNPPTDPDMAENFNAFSEYISTVIDYLGHL